MAVIISEQTLTEEEYIAYELSSEDKHEYVDGKLITMPGERDLNNEIAANVLFLLRRLLRSKGYSMYIEGVKVKLPDESQYYYPDVFVTREKTDETNQYTKHKPEIIFEVLSNSTRKYDLVDKFIAYQRIPSLVYYLAVEPDKVLVQLFYKENDDWEMMSFTGIDDVIDLPALQIQLPVKEIYKPE